MGREGGLYCKILVVWVLALTGCGQDHSHTNQEVMCRITLDGCSFGTKSMDPDEEIVSDISIMIFDEHGDAEECIWLTNGQTFTDVPLVLGKRYCFRACANFGYRTYADHVDELKETVYYMAYPDEYRQGMPMYAAADNIRIGEDAAVNLKLIRLMSKISLRMDRRRLSKGVQMNVTGVRIGNCPKSIKVFQPNTITSNDQCFSMGFSRDDAQSAILNTTSEDNISGTLTLYMLENMQGEMDTTVNNDGEKVFDENDHRREVCSYIEMEIEYLSYEQYSEKPLIYRFYLGDSMSNLDVERNCHYSITVCPEDDGLKGDGWRVDKSGMSDLGPTFLRSYPSSYIRGKIGDKIHLGCIISPPHATFDVGESYMAYDESEGIYEYEIDPDGLGATLTLTGPGCGWIYMEAGEPINDGALFVIEVDLPR